MNPTVFEICAGAGGQSLGLDMAGFSHVGAVEIDPDACKTLLLNRSHWNVLLKDVREVDGNEYGGVDLLAGGVPCPPFSIAGKQLGSDDERDLFPEALRLVAEVKPLAVMLENVRGFASEKFASYRHRLFTQLHQLGYEASWRVLHASDYCVPQLRPRFILVALRPPYYEHFVWPTPVLTPLSVGETLADLMAAGGWPGVDAWRERANGIAPTLVGGSKKHGGPDLGPTRARRQWAELGVDGLGVVDNPPDASFPVDAMPRLTTRMAARIQGFPDSWHFSGRKTAAYRQVGNAFPPPVAAAVGRAILHALSRGNSSYSLGDQLRLITQP